MAKRNSSLEYLYSMNHLPAPDSVQYKPQALKSDSGLPPWAIGSLDDIHFSRHLTSLVANSSPEAKQSIKGCLEQDLALAVASKIQDHL